MADVRTFRAASLDDALRIVHEQLGQQAVVLQTREVSRTRWLPWLAPRTEVEVTAGRADEARGPRSHVQHRSDFGLTWAPGGSDDGLDLDRLEPQVTGERPRSTDKPAAEAPPAPRHPDSFNQLASRLDSIQTALDQLGQTNFISRAADAPVELFELYAELIDADVEENLARELLQRLKRQSPADALQSVDLARTLLTGMVESDIRCTPAIEVIPQQRKVVALVGPTGVGKTTTLAKLAANFRLRDGVRMGLVTVDTYRIAAVEQLRTYAEIIDLPMKVVTSPPEMRRALDELQGMDLVLIDTAGRSPRDELKIQELKKLLDEARVDEVHLVLSLTAGLKNLISTIRNFRPAGISSLILTKLDEAESLGSVLSLAQQIELPVSYLTTGQDVPDDIEPALAPRLTRLVLGQEFLN